RPGSERARCPARTVPRRHGSMQLRDPRRVLLPRQTPGPGAPPARRLYYLPRRGRGYGEGSAFREWLDGFRAGRGLRHLGHLGVSTAARGLQAWHVLSEPGPPGGASELGLFIDRLARSLRTDGAFLPRGGRAPGCFWRP